MIHCRVSWSDQDCVIRPHRMQNMRMRPIFVDVFWSVCMSVCLFVCLLVTTVSPTTKAAQPIEAPFGVWTRVGRMNRVLGRGPDSFGQFWGTSRSRQPSSASDCSVRGPRFKSRLWQLCLSQQLLWYTVLSTGCSAPLLQCLDRLSLSPFVGQ